MVNLPFVISGTITDYDATHPNGAKVVLRNNTNGETTSKTTNSSGKYVLDAANLTSGYLQTDRITIYCSWGLADGESSFLISSDTHTANITLTTVADSVDVSYCTIQDVYDELGDKGTSDISFNRVRKSILRAEKEIEERTDTTFTNTLVTDEIYDFNQYTGYKSPEQFRSYDAVSRNDYFNVVYNDRLQIEKHPILNPYTQLNGDTTTSATSLTVDSTTNFPSSGTVFIYDSTNGTEQITYTGTTSTTLTGCTRAANSTTATAHADNSYVTMFRASKNSAGKTSTDSWEDLEPQLGGGGDFIVHSDISLMDFIDNIPAFGKRRIKLSYSYGYKTVPKTVERLTILITIRDILLSKAHASQFDSIDSISLEGISISKGIGGSISYISSINKEIESLWLIVGDMVSKPV